MISCVRYHVATDPVQSQKISGFVPIFAGETDSTIGAEGATAPEALRPKDRKKFQGTLESRPSGLTEGVSLNQQGEFSQVP